MPFKDIDFKKLNETEELRQALNKKIAVISKLNDPNLKASERIATAELVSGKPHQPKVNISKQLLQQQETSRSLAPVLKEIDALKDEIHNRHQVLELEDIPKKAIEGPPIGVDLYERFGFTDSDIEYYKDKDFTDLNTLALANDQGVIQETLRQITKQIKKLGTQKGAINRKKRPHPIDLERIQVIQREQDSVDRYRNVLKKL